MIKLEKVAILGLGAMGAYFASRFLVTQSITTTIVAAGERYALLEKNGLKVNDRNFDLPLTAPDEITDPADLIIIALKHQQLPGALQDVRNLIGEQTTIISVMNGLDSEQQIGSIYGMDKLLYTISVGIDAVREEGAVTYTNPGKQIFGEAENSRISPKVRKIQEIFQRAEIPYETPVDMIQTLWWKFMINVGMNQASAVLRAPYGVFQKSPDAQQLMEALMREVIILAQAEGIDLGEQAIADWYPVLHSLSPSGKTSMLQDIEANRKTEVEIFGDKVLELSEKHLISSPVNRTLVQAIRVQEQYLCSS